ncbi:ArsR family transcriptional regulator [Kitasatospora cheerisanensis KCTC 2395]|uniref:ArsR family transcriptional regulator n=1 Tax=Kitasatospora cheerisanensis KCTC 2395 TaxID=1348663 RepID=A0A066YX98_9ACTN|nr:ArsR family transcriptional regulator [Kitasatospora cheerisanensis KCTC 2395]
MPATAAEALSEGHRATRERVARSILDHGPSSAADLASRLGLTAAAVRRHLDGLAAAGLVESREQRVYGSRGRGRPAKVFALTDGGRDAFHQAYDQLAADALRWISEAAGGGEAGEQAVAAFARARLAAQGRKYQGAVEQADAQQRAEALARALSADGYAATVRRVPTAGAAPPPRPARSSASTTARSRTSPSSSRSSARRRPRSSRSSSAPMCNGWPPSPTATGSAPRMCRHPVPHRRPRGRPVPCRLPVRPPTKPAPPRGGTSHD